ncbi:hypothetical protein COV18_06315 [Candidatus Woesearchaeota archaeon CG10_big_fil_rev_8_21_14_0_10_37_12]|nr:MAG: hypothetical protein COV18_06315 [Candidatus Woesearchaeota archaeon CG10_big_fil_rev_8_21_14_0_10_37_12]
MNTHRIILSITVVAIVVFVLFSRPSITGYVATETHYQNLDITVDESQQLDLSWQTAPSKLLAVSLSGQVQGTGLVNVYFVAGQNKWLVYSNKQKRDRSMTSITGLATNELAVTQGKTINKIETVEDDYLAVPEVFQNQCIESCSLDRTVFTTEKVKLEVIIEPGTNLNINEIRYATLKK